MSMGILIFSSSGSFHWYQEIATFLAFLLALWRSLLCQVPGGPQLHGSLLEDIVSYNKSSAHEPGNVLRVPETRSLLSGTRKMGNTEGQVLPRGKKYGRYQT